MESVTTARLFRSVMRSTARPREPGACNTRLPGRALFLQGMPPLDQRVSGVDMSSMMTQLGPFTSPITFITSDTLGLRPALVDDREVRLQALRASRGPAPRATSGETTAGSRTVLPTRPPAERSRVNLSTARRKSLDLVGVQIHRQHPVHSCRLKHVRHHFRADRHARRPGARSWRQTE